jgi:hypothetical protein
MINANNTMLLVVINQARMPVKGIFRTASPIPSLRLLSLDSGGIYVKALRDVQDAELVGVVDLVPEKLGAFAKEHNIPHKATNL